MGVGANHQNLPRRLNQILKVASIDTYQSEVCIMEEVTFSFMSTTSLLQFTLTAHSHKKKKTQKLHCTLSAQHHMATVGQH